MAAISSNRLLPLKFLETSSEHLIYESIKEALKVTHQSKFSLRKEKSIEIQDHIRTIAKESFLHLCRHINSDTKIDPLVHKTVYLYRNPLEMSVKWFSHSCPHTIGCSPSFKRKGEILLFCSNAYLVRLSRKITKSSKEMMMKYIQQFLREIKTVAEKFRLLKGKGSRAFKPLIRHLNKIHLINESTSDSLAGTDCDHLASLNHIKNSCQKCIEKMKHITTKISKKNQECLDLNTHCLNEIIAKTEVLKKMYDPYKHLERKACSTKRKLTCEVQAATAKRRRPTKSATAQKQKI